MKSCHLVAFNQQRRVALLTNKSCRGTSARTGSDNNTVETSVCNHRYIYPKNLVVSDGSNDKCVISQVELQLFLFRLKLIWLAECFRLIRLARPN